MSSFFESYDFSNIIVIPFCTSHSSEIGTSAIYLHKLTASSTSWLEGKRFDENTSQSLIEEWLNSLSL